MAENKAVSISNRSLRIVQAICVAVVVAAIVPWSDLVGSTVIGAIHSKQAPLAMSIAAWFVLLVPLWVIWFALRAWEQRDESYRDAVIMAVPPVIVSATALLLNVMPLHILS